MYTETTTRSGRPQAISLPSNVWPSSFDDVDESDEFEYDAGGLNLGAETPVTPSTPSSDAVRRAVYEWASKTPGLAMNGPSGPHSWAPKPALVDTRRELDMDCGICFENTSEPCRTLCCGKLFCHAHITGWLHGPDSDGRCPTCQLPCAFERYPSSQPTSSLHKIFAPSPITPSAIRILPAHRSDDTAADSMSPTASTFVSSSWSDSSLKAKKSQITSARQRSSSSYLHATFHDDINAADADEDLELMQHHLKSMFISPETQRLLARLFGRILTLAGLLIIFLVLMQR